MTDLSKLPPLHPERVKAAEEFFADGDGWKDPAWSYRETAHAALEVVQKLQTGFGFAPDLYDKVEMAKKTASQGQAIFNAVKSLIGKK